MNASTSHYNGSIIAIENTKRGKKYLHRTKFVSSKKCVFYYRFDSYSIRKHLVINYLFYGLNSWP